MSELLILPILVVLAFVYAYLLGSYRGYCKGLDDAKDSIREALGIEKGDE